MGPGGGRGRETYRPLGVPSWYDWGDDEDELDWPDLDDDESMFEGNIVGRTWISMSPTISQAGFFESQFLYQVNAPAIERFAFVRHYFQAFDKDIVTVTQRCFTPSHRNPNELPFCPAFISILPQKHNFRFRRRISHLGSEAVSLPDPLRTTCSKLLDPCCIL